jgi:hypothetical protein
MERELFIDFDRQAAFTNEIQQAVRPSHSWL